MTIGHFNRLTILMKRRIIVYLSYVKKIKECSIFKRSQSNRKFRFQAVIVSQLEFEKQWYQIKM